MKWLFRVLLNLISGIVLPLWMVMLITLPLPAVRIAVWRRRRGRVAAGHCRVCGYDRRATPDRCPECGTAAAV